MTLSDADIAAIRAAIDEDSAAVRRADWDSVVRMFTADAIRFPPHQAPIRGRAAMRAWLATFPPIQQFTISADENRRLRRCGVRARSLRANGGGAGNGADDRPR